MNGKTLIIAEAGVNHNGDLELAKGLIDVAAGAGADFVKFQTFKADKLVSRDAQKAAYQKKNLGGSDDSQFEMLKKLEMPEEWHHLLIAYAAEKGIPFLSTGFDEESIDFLAALKMPFFKVPSGELTNKPFLQHIAEKGKPVVVSTGMATMAEVEAALEVLRDAGVPHDKLTVLHCNTEYPTPYGDVNLRAMNTIARQLGVAVGYSDHTLGIEVPIAAVALGARVIEKHFTLDRTLPGPDHAASLEPAELVAMVKAIRNIEAAMAGSGLKTPSASESKNIAVARKSVHLKHPMEAGQVIRKENLEMKRPGDGISPMDVDLLINRCVNKSLPAGHKLTQSDLLP